MKEMITVYCRQLNLYASCQLVDLFGGTKHQSFCCSSDSWWFIVLLPFLYIFLLCGPFLSFSSQLPWNAFSDPPWMSSAFNICIFPQNYFQFHLWMTNCKEKHEMCWFISLAALNLILWANEWNCSHTSVFMLEWRNGIRFAEYALGHFVCKPMKNIMKKKEKNL